jgi:hypothetical protein
MQTIILEENNPDIIKQKLRLELRDYNHPFLGDYHRKNFALYIEDIGQNVIAGIYGFMGRSE